MFLEKITVGGESTEKKTCYKGFRPKRDFINVIDFTPFISHRNYCTMFKSREFALLETVIYTVIH